MYASFPVTFAKMEAPPAPESLFNKGLAEKYARLETVYMHTVKELLTLREQVQKTLASRAELEAVHSATLRELAAVREKNSALLGKLKQAFTCQVCREVAFAPMVVGPCGHISCGQCDEQVSRLSTWRLSIKVSVCVH